MPEVATDLRWDADGFNRACERAQILWVRVAWLKGLHARRGVLPRRQDLPEEAVGRIGPPPPRCALYFVSYCKAGHLHRGPSELTLKQLVKALEDDGALGEDLVLLDEISMFVDGQTREQLELFDVQFDHATVFVVFHRMRFVCLPAVAKGDPGYFERGWPIFEFTMAAYTSRIVTSDKEEVAKHLSPEFLMSFDVVMVKAIFSKGADEKGDKERLKDFRRQFAKAMPLAREDAAGFRVACEQAQYRWVRVSYLRSWRRRRGPPPRHQDLPRSAYVDGAVPEGRQAFVVSYAWAAHLHPFPNGGKVRRLVDVLDELEADDADVVFLDFMSLPQGRRRLPRAYKDANPQAKLEVPEEPRRCTSWGLRRCRRSAEVAPEPASVPEPADAEWVVLPDRTDDEETQFRCALFETTRLYAYQGCKVIVLPSCEDPPESFCRPEEIMTAKNKLCEPHRDERCTPYGFCKDFPYESGGWTCTEYAVARKNGTIANWHHADVQRVEASRMWPDNVREFADMMDEKATKPVRFTKGGDREGVRFNFYKYCYHMNDLE